MSARAVPAGPPLAPLGEQLDRLFAALQPIARTYAAVITTNRTAGRDDLAPVRPTVFDVLDTHRGLIAGAGVITAPTLLRDAPYWIDWWWTRPSGTHEALRVNLDPAAPDFFDYTTADWFTTPERTSARHIAGPYVDYACTNQYSLTAAIPVHVHAEFIGVAAADVLIASLEPLLIPLLRRQARPTALVSAAGRVIASTAPHLPPGTLLTPGTRTRVTRRRQPAAVHGINGIDWHLVDIEP